MTDGILFLWMYVVGMSAVFSLIEPGSGSKSAAVVSIFWPVTIPLLLVIAFARRAMGMH